MPTQNKTKQTDYGFLKFVFIKFSFLLFFISVFLILPIKAFAATYYVDGTITDAHASSATPDCTNYNPATFTCSGGTDSAFAKLADINVFASLQPGDIVYFRKGQAFQKTSGILSFLPGVTYGAFGSGNNPQLEGATLLTTWTLYSGNIYTATTTLADHVRFMVWEGDTRGTRQTSLGAVVSPGDFYLDDPANTLYYISRGGGNPNQYTIHADTNHNPYQITGNNGRLENLVFAYAGAALLVNQSGGGATSGWVISNVRFTNSMLHGFGQFGGTSGTSLTFLNSEFDHNVQYGFVAAGPSPNGGLVNSIFDGCSFHDNVLAGISLDGPGGSTSSANIIRNSTAYNNGGDGLAIGANGIDDIIQDSVAHDNGQLTDDRTGIKSFGLRTIIRRNVSYNNNLNFVTGHGFQFDTVAANGLMYDNIAYGNAGDGISFMGSGHKIYNNTVYGNLGRALATGGIGTFGSGTYTSIEIKNNIIYNNGQSGVPGSRYQLYDSNHLNSPTNQIDHNLYFDPESHTNLIRFGTTNYNTLSAFTTATGQDARSIESDPLLSNAAGNDFHLLSGSPAINTGIDVSLTSDFVLNSIIGFPDMGAYEFQLASAPASLAQYKLDGATVINSGDWTNQAGVVLKFNMTSGNNTDSLIPQVEVRGNSVSFSNTVTNASTSAAAYSGSPVLGSVIVTGLADGIYHWQASATNSAGNSAWIAKGGNPDFRVDANAPSGGSITYTDGYYTASSAALTVSDGTDLFSGVNTSTRTIQRRSATLSNGTCGSYSSFATITPTGSYPSYTDTGISSGNCYQYQYLVSDNVGNQATYTNANTVKIDVDAPSAPGAPSTTSPTSSSSQTWSWSAATDSLSGIANYLWRTTGTAVVSGSTNVASAVTSLAAGVYNFFVRAVDNAGNQGVEASAGTLTVVTPVPTTPPTSSGSSSNTSSGPSPFSCGSNIPPSFPPSLYQIIAGKNSATLYLAPAGSPVAFYSVAYGPSENPEQYGVNFDNNGSNGAIVYTINYLKQNSTYSFKVKAGNGCQTTSWSQSIQASTSSLKHSFYPGIASTIFNTTQRVLGGSMKKIIPDGNPQALPVVLKKLPTPTIAGPQPSAMKKYVKPQPTDSLWDKILGLFRPK